jgi:hypothetical protein
VCVIYSNTYDVRINVKDKTETKQEETEAANGEGVETQVESPVIAENSVHFEKRHKRKEDWGSLGDQFGLRREEGKSFEVSVYPGSLGRAQKLMTRAGVGSWEVW